MRTNETTTRRALSILLWVTIPSALATSAAAMGDLRKGQVVVGVKSSGLGAGFRVFSNSGLYLEDLSDGTTALPHGAFFDWFGDELYATTTAGQFGQVTNLVLFDGAHPHASQQALDLDALGMLGVASMVRDRAGSLYLGDQSVSLGTTFIRKLSPSLALLNTYSVVTFTPGIKSLAVTQDGGLAYYVVGGLSLSRYDLANQVQLSALFLPDFASKVVLLPPFSASAELLVLTTSFAGTLARVRRIDAAGNTLQIYDFPGEFPLAGVGLDPNGSSFWVVSSAAAPLNTMGNLYRVGLATGLVEVGPVALGSSGPSPLTGVSLAVIERPPKIRHASPLPPVLPFPVLSGPSSPAWFWLARP